MKPTPGMPATIQIGSDRYAMVVEQVSFSGKSLIVKYLDKNLGEEVVRLNKKGYYAAHKGTSRITLGVASDYRNPEF